VWGSARLRVYLVKSPVMRMSFSITLEPVACNTVTSNSIHFPGKRIQKLTKCG